MLVRGLQEYKLNLNSVIRHCHLPTEADSMCMEVLLFILLYKVIKVIGYVPSICQAYRRKFSKLGYFRMTSVVAPEKGVWSSHRAMLYRGTLREPARYLTGVQEDCGASLDTSLGKEAPVGAPLLPEDTEHTRPRLPEAARRKAVTPGGSHAAMPQE